MSEYIVNNPGSIPSNTNLDINVGDTLVFNTTSTVAESYKGTPMLWTVPKTGTYLIDIAGGCGQDKTRDGSSSGGGGAIIKAPLFLEEGIVLEIIVGMGKKSASGEYGGSGGGGTFIVNNKLPILVAGGGGGSGIWENKRPLINNLKNGSTSTTGFSSQDTNIKGGANGLGGFSGNYGDGGISTPGAGFYGNANVSTGSDNFSLIPQCYPSLYGGQHKSKNNGCYGGGGATYYGGAGGGGYSGGGSWTHTSPAYPSGGGGGSFIETSLLSSIGDVSTSDGKYNENNLIESKNIINLNLYNFAPGYCKITLLQTNTIKAHCKIDGTIREVDNMSVKVDGAWKEVDSVYIKVDGNWKKSE